MDRESEIVQTVPLWLTLLEGEQAPTTPFIQFGNTLLQLAQINREHVLSLGKGEK